MREKTPRKFSTTPGTRDVLPPESTRLLDVQAEVLKRFRLHGFREIVTPALEYSEVIEEPKLRDSAFKLFDPDNQMLLLRPEVTTPVARLVAQRLRNMPPPHKLSYSLPVYRRTGVGRGQSAEFRQAGVEAVGSASPGEDAGTIAVLVDVLRTLGLRPGTDFALVLGQAAFYRGYLNSVVPGVAAEVLAALADKDLVRVDEISSTLQPEVAAAVRELPRLVGPATDGAVLERAERYAGESGDAGAALGNLRLILDHLAAVGCLDGVMLDFGLIGRHDYYTGAVYEVYASGLGFTVANGGRYDNLLRRFGEPLPATGFAISLERLVSVLPEREPAPLVVLVGASVEATRKAGDLRGFGVPVLHLAEDLPQAEAADYARSVEAGWVGYPVPEGVKLVSTTGEEPGIVPVDAVAGRVMR
ncbi:ATP phosphoribosyltransferase regulatory subunit [Rubrobacter tropicus]|uniref:ATP phosphoribosyltransferase regulatory subunit n=1 Tax=Rubrobacter tropicus TaxID=2653851 RepID=A0A6G8Q844_9ACTN|nr:ATP phosphoribosyltransferase regulatory subunit [Rubrobacter tropicus]QIN82655.1 ATP phosphoribosyltransferase regulatory subunit [Rubrobacter tropicus]